MEALYRAFLARLSDDARFDGSSPDVPAALAARFEAGAKAWPTVALDASLYGGHLGERTTEGNLPSVDRAADLYLACACEHEIEGAIEAFQRAFRATMVQAAAAVDPSPAFADDVVQEVSQRVLLKNASSRARIAEYGGRASLRGWLGTVAKRTALNMRRNLDDRSHDSPSGHAAALGTAVGPEVELLKAYFRDQFTATIRSSLDKLAPRERALLLMHFVEGMTLPQLATMHRVSRATVARWIASAREALHDATRDQIRGSLRLSSSEYASVAALVRSQLDVSLAAGIRDAP